MAYLNISEVIIQIYVLLILQRKNIKIHSHIDIWICLKLQTARQQTNTMSPIDEVSKQ
jgi:hypothetical protein